MRDFYEKWWAETRPMMVNEERAVLEGGSRISTEDVIFREKMQQQKEGSSISFPLILDMVHNNPGEAPYQTNYNNPEVIKNMGYNGKVYFLFESPMLAINWESVDKDILPVGSEERKWADAKAAVIKKEQAACHQAGRITSYNVCYTKLLRSLR